MAKVFKRFQQILWMGILTGGWMFQVFPAEAAKVWFTTPELRIAAEDLAGFISRQPGGPVTAELANMDQVFMDGDWVVVNLTRNRNTTVEKAISLEDKAWLQGNGNESYCAWNQKGVRYLVGAGHRGSINAVLRVQSAWLQQKSQPISDESRTTREKPIWVDRIGGACGPDSEQDYGQPRPSDYGWEQYARNLAAYGINVTPGVIQGDPVPDEILRGWGIKKILFASACPFSPAKLREWRANRTVDLKPGDNPWNQDSSANLMPCISSAEGQELYGDWVKSFLANHREATRLVFYFADWGISPPDGCEGTGQPRWSRCLSFLIEMEGLVKQNHPECQVFLATRGFSADDLVQIMEKLPVSMGIYFEEPTQPLLSGQSPGSIPSAFGSQTMGDYGPVLQNAIRRFGNNCILAIGGGGTDYYVSPALGVIPPRITWDKLQQARTLGATHIAFAMGGVHPWSYTPSMKIFSEMVWSEQADLESLLESIAQRDFGSAANQVRAAWDQFDRACSLSILVSRIQGLESYIRMNKTPITRWIKPIQLKESIWAQQMTPSIPFLIDRLPQIIRTWEAGLNYLESAQSQLESSSIEMVSSLRDEIFWNTFHIRMLRSQLNSLRCLNILQWVPQGEDPESPQWKEAFVPIMRDELDNCEGWLNLIGTPTEERIRVDKDPVAPTVLTRDFQQKRDALKQALGL